MSDDDPREAARLEVVAFFDACEEREMAIDERVTELAKLVGCSKASVYNWRAGGGGPQKLAVPLVTQALAKLRKKYDLG